MNSRSLEIEFDLCDLEYGKAEYTISTFSDLRRGIVEVQYE